MSTTLSQRLRDLRDVLMSEESDTPNVMNLVDDCIAQAEAQEAQGMELSDEEVGRAAMDSIPADSHVGLALDQDGAIDMARAFFERGLRYARDHGYLKPSQAIGEQKPVVRWEECGSKYCGRLQRWDKTAPASQPHSSTE